MTRGRCCVAEPVYPKDHFEQMKQVIKLWGIVSHNIFENPLYQLLFSVDEAFAEKHRHLEDLGDIDNLVQKSVSLEMTNTAKPGAGRWESEGKLAQCASTKLTYTLEINKYTTIKNNEM